MEYQNRAQRIKCQCPIRLIQEDGTRYQGMTRDLSLTGFSAFIKNTNLPSSAQPDFATLEKTFFDKVFMAQLELEARVGPYSVEIIRVENSWLKEFDAFVAISFISGQDAELQALQNYISERMAKSAAAEMEKIEERVLLKLDPAKSDFFQFSFPSRFMYIRHARDLCEHLASTIGFSELDRYHIKVAADEICTNAFKHGSPEYGHSRILLKLTLDRRGIFVQVRDQGGNPFNDAAYRKFDKAHPETSRTGLRLVNKFVDGWGVETVSGQYTEVTFYKLRS